MEHQGKGFQVQPKLGSVERTWAWLKNARALNRDYERLPENHEGMVYVAMIRLMLRRLGHNRRNWNKKEQNIHLQTFSNYHLLVKLIASRITFSNLPELITERSLINLIEIKVKFDFCLIHNLARCL